MIPEQCPVSEIFADGEPRDASAIVYTRRKVLTLLLSSGVLIIGCRSKTPSYVRVVLGNCGGIKMQGEEVKSFEELENKTLEGINKQRLEAGENPLKSD